MNEAKIVSMKPGGDIMESVLIKGDLSKLSPQERSTYYLKVCESAGLNPLTQPFAYITLNGKLTLYALRAATDQLRTIHKVSVDELSESERDGVFIVTAKVKNAEGRTDMAKGAVTISNLKGDALANAMMKAETKAKRRATLSLCGLGFLDETEIETIPGATNGKRVAVQQTAPAHDAETGEIVDDDLPVALDRRPISPVQVERLQAIIVEVGANIDRFCRYMKVPNLESIPSNQFQFAVDALEAKRAQKS